MVDMSVAVMGASMVASSAALKDFEGVAMTADVLEVIEAVHWADE